LQLVVAAALMAELLQAGTAVLAEAGQKVPVEQMLVVLLLKARQDLETLAEALLLALEVAEEEAEVLAQ